MVSKFDVSTNMRAVLRDEAQWSRAIIVDGVAHASGNQYTGERLLAAEDAIAAGLGQFYGSAFQNQLASLLHDRATGLTAIVAGAVGSRTAIRNRRIPWLANADRIATLVASVNPNVSQTELQAQLEADRESTLAEIDARVASNWDADITAYNVVSARVNAIADSISSGLAKQFPAVIISSTLSSLDQALRSEMSAIFNDSVFWMRAVLVEHRAADEIATLNRFTQTGADFANALVPFYGPEQSAHFATMYHAVAIADPYAYLLAVNSSERSTAQTLLAQWYGDSRRLTDFLATQTPAWAAAGDSMSVYVAQTARQIDAYTAQDWPDAISAYDATVTSGVAISSLFADGLSTLTTRPVCMANLRVGVVTPSNATCSMPNLAVATGDEGLLSYTCLSDAAGWADARLGNESFSGTSTGTTVSTSVHTLIPAANGCWWDIEQSVTGDVGSGVLSFTYAKRNSAWSFSLSNQDCPGACTAEGPVYLSPVPR